jgi:signal transduction histidine kinase
MRRSASLAPVIAAASVPTAAAARTEAAGLTEAATRTEVAGLAELAQYRTEDHDRIARGLNDVVIHRIFAASLDLQAALGLIGDHSGSGKIRHAIDELDHAIRDIREIIYDRDPGEPRRFPRPGGSRTGG